MIGRHFQNSQDDEVENKQLESKNEKRKRTKFLVYRAENLKLISTSKGGESTESVHRPAMKRPPDNILFLTK